MNFSVVILLFLTILLGACVPVSEEQKDKKSPVLDAGAKTIRPPLMILGIEDEITSQSTKKWNWNCSGGEICVFKYVIDRSANTIPLGPYGNYSYAQIINGTGRYYIHLQGKDLSGRETSVKHISIVFNNIVPEIDGLINDFSITNSKTWMWGCRFADCQYRHVINSSPTHSFVSEPFSSVNFATKSFGNGTFYLHAQGKNIVNNLLSSVKSVSVNFDDIPPVLNDKENDLSVRSIKSWNWACQNSEVCNYRFSIDQFPFSSVSGPFSSTKSVTISNLSGTYYLHVQAQDLAGNLSSTRHSFVVMDPGIPEVLGLAHDVDLKKSKTWNWFCNFNNCSFRTALTQSSSHTFSGNELFNTSQTFTHSSGNGVFYLHIQAKNLSNDKLGPSQSYSTILDNAKPLVAGVGEDDLDAKLEKSWSWFCSLGEACTFRYLVDSTLTSTPTGTYGTADAVTISGESGNKVLHIQAKDSAGNESDVVHRRFIIADKLPEVTNLLEDSVVKQSKTFTWGCSESDCLYRQEINQFPSHTFDESVNYSGNTTVTKNDGTGTFYIHVQPLNSENSIEGKVFSKFFVLDNDPPSVQMVGNDPVVQPNKTWNWSCNELNCSYRTAINQSSTHTYSISDLFSTSTSLTGDTGTGTFYIHVQAKDVVGNLSTVVSRSFQLNNSAPIVTGISDDLSPTNLKNFSWGCSGFNCIYRFVINTSSSFTFTNQIYGSSVGAIKNDGSGTFYLHVQAKDITNGLESAVKSVSFIMNAKKPIVTGLSNQLSPVKTQNLNWGCSSPENDVGIICKYRYAFNGNSTHQFGSEPFLSDNSFTLSGDTNTTYLHIQAQNATTGIIGDLQNYQIELDNTVPLLTGLSNQTTTASSATWNWGCDDALGCTYRFVVDTISGTIPGGSYGTTTTFTQPSGNATYYLHIQARDMAGNEGVLEHKFAVIDNNLPNLTGIVADATPTKFKEFSWGCSAVNCSYRFVINDIDPLITPHVFGGEDYISTNSANYNVGNGTFYIHIQTKNTDTSVEGTVESFSFEMDTTPPSVTGLLDDTGILLEKIWNWGCSEVGCTYAFVSDNTAVSDPGLDFSSDETLTLSGNSGTFYLHIRARDLAGNIGDIVHVTVTLDIFAPVVNGLSSIIIPQSSNTWVWDCSFSGDCEFRYVLNLSATHTFTTEIYGSTQTATQSIGDGVYYLHVQARKISTGSISEVKTVSALIDNTSPVVTGITPDSGTVTSITWNWGCTDVSDCEYRILIDTTSNSVPIEDYNGLTSETFSEEFGTYYIHVQAKDELGNESAVVHGEVFFDNRVPFFTNLPSDNVTPVSEASFSWLCSIDPDPCEFRYVVTDVSSHIFSISDPWNTDSDYIHNTGDGTKYFHIETRNPVNNTASTVETRSFEMDTTPPTINDIGGTLVDDTVIAISKVWSWSCSEDPNCTFRYAIDNVATEDVDTIWTSWDDAFTTATQATGTGRFYLHLQARDLALAETSVINVYVDIDNTTPVISGVADDSIAKKIKVWNWDCADNGPDYVNCEFRFIVNQTSTHTFVSEPWVSTKTATQASGDGTYYLHVQARKPVNGLISTASSTSALLDNTAPLAAVNLALDPVNGSTSVDLTPEITGDSPGEDGAIISIYEDASCLTGVKGTATVTGGVFTVNNITYASDGSDNGLKNYYANLSDVAGNSTGCTDLSLSYTLDTTPGITLLDRTSDLSAGGAVLTIDGLRFSNTGNTVLIGTQACAILTESSTQITCTIPANLPEGVDVITRKDVTVTNTIPGSKVLTNGFTYLGSTNIDLKFWMDSSDISSLFTDAGCVAAATIQDDEILCLQDKSGRGNNVVSSVGLGPLLKLSNIASRNSLYFDGDSLSQTSVSDFDLADNKYSVFIAIQLKHLSNGSTGFPFRTNSNISKGILTSYLSGIGTSALSSSVFTTNAASNNASMGNFTDENTPLILMDVGEVGVERKTGRDGTETGQSTILVDFDGEDAVLIGDSIKGDILEVIFFDRLLSAQERADINNYLKNKWGVP